MKKPLSYEFTLGSGDNMIYYFEQLESLIRAERGGGLQLIPDEILLINEIVLDLPYDDDFGTLVNMANMFGSFLGKMIMKYTGVGYWKAATFNNNVVPAFFYLMLDRNKNYVVDPVTVALKAIKTKDPIIFWHYFFHVIHEIKRISNGNNPYNLYPGYFHSLVEKGIFVNGYLDVLYSETSLKNDWEKELMKGINLCSSDPHFSDSERYVANKYKLEKTDRTYGSENSVVIIRKATQRIEAERKVLLSSYLCNYIFNLIHNQSTKSEFRQSLDSQYRQHPNLPTNVVSSHIIENLKELEQIIDCYLTLAYCNVEAQDGAFLFRFTKRDDNQRFLIMMGISDFINAYDALPLSIRDEMHEKVLKLNSNWREDWRSYLAKQYDVFTQGRYMPPLIL